MANSMTDCKTNSGSHDPSAPAADGDHFGDVNEMILNQPY
jgi:hypothetical protein